MRFSISHSLLLAIPTLLAFLLLGLLSAHAQSCTTLFPSGEAAPGGYGASWNPFTSARELLLAGTCNGDTVAVTIGSDQPNQYVFNQSFHWNGTEWRQIQLQGSNPAVGNWIPRQGKGSFNKGNQNPAIFVGYVCQFVNDNWRCGCADQACSAPRWQVQALQTQTGGGGGGGGGTSGPQCDILEPPPQARAAGLTKLEFCDDFSKQSLSLTDNFDITGDYKWTRQLSFGYQPESPSAFTFSNGALRIAPTQNVRQWTITSAIVRNGQLQGYLLDGSKPFYTEVRWKYDNERSTSTGFPAFWSMASCHTLGYPGPCPNGEFIEPDFFEYIGGREITATHFHDSDYKPKHPVTRCNNSSPDAIDRTEWHTNGALVQAPASITYFQNNTQRNRLLPDQNCVSRQATSTSKARDALSRIPDLLFPIQLGTGSTMPIELDYVTVWSAP